MLVEKVPDGHGSGLNVPSRQKCPAGHTLFLSPSRGVLVLAPPSYDIIVYEGVINIYFHPDTLTEYSFMKEQSTFISTADTLTEDSFMKEQSTFISTLTL